MPSYQATACKIRTDGRTEMVASREFDAPDTAVAKALADTWSYSADVVPLEAAVIRLYAGKVLLSIRSLPDGVWSRSG